MDKPSLLQYAGHHVNTHPHKARAVLRVGLDRNGTPCFFTTGTHPRIKDVMGASYDKEGFRWVFPAYLPVGLAVLRDLGALQIPITFSDDVHAHAKRLQRFEQLAKAGTLPPGLSLVTVPFQHQREGLAHLLYNHRAAIYFDPGLGKSKVFVDYLLALREREGAPRALVVGPLITVTNFGREIDKHSGGSISWAAVLGTREQRMNIVRQAVQDGTQVLIVTYGFVVSCGDAIVSTFRPTVFCADEAHRLSDPDTAVCWACVRVAATTSRRVLMTGTATLGNPLRIYGQLKVLGDCFAPENYHTFKRRHLQVDPMNEHNIIGYKGVEVLRERLAQVALRRKREDCLDLPPRTFVDVEFSLTEAQWKVYAGLATDSRIALDSVRQAFTATSRGQPEYVAPNSAVLVQKLSQIRSGFLLTSTRDPFICDACPHLHGCVARDVRPYTKECQVAVKPPTPDLQVFEQNPMLTAFAEVLDTVLADSSAKVLVWGRYSFPGAELDLVEAFLQAHGIGYTRLRAKNAARGSELAEEFCTNPQKKVWLSHVAMGIGLTFSPSYYTVYLNLPYHLDFWDQSLDRNYRIGTSRPVTVYVLLARGTVDAEIYNMLRSKKSLDDLLTGAVPVTSDTVRRARINWRSFDVDTPPDEHLDTDDGPGCLHDLDVVASGDGAPF